MLNLKSLSRKELIRLAEAKHELSLRQRLNPIDFFEPLKHQRAFHESNKKNKTILGGNRSGKTINTAKYIIEKCLVNNNFKARASTWADMSVPIQQKTVFDLLPKKEISYADFSERRGFVNKIIQFKNGSQIRFKTYEQGQRSYQGAGLDLEWNDEEAPQEIVSEQKARLIDRNGELIRSMTPLNGITYTYDEVILNEKDNKEIDYWFWDSSLNIYINQESLRNVIGSYAEKEAEVRKTGHFQNLKTGLSYYPFSDENIIDSFRYMPDRPLEISCDFNIELMCWNIGQGLNDKDYVFDFVELEDFANTELLCETLRSKYPKQRNWIFYGDISGGQRRPEAAQTNWAIIENYFPGAELYYQNIKNIKHRVDATNSRLCNSLGMRRYFITKNCKRLIKDYRQVTWEMLLNKTKAGKLTHASDGESYKMLWKYDLRGEPTTQIISRI